MMSRNAALFSGKYIEYVTPKKLYQQLDAEFHFVLDPCTTKDNPLNAPICFTKEDDGLSQEWNHCVIDNDGLSRQAVYVNPPYGKNIIDWVKKAYSQSGKHDITIVMLLPARVDTRWFHDYIYNKPNVEIRFIRGRLKFETSVQHIPNTAPFPSLIVIFHPRRKRRRSNYRNEQVYRL